MIHPDLKIFDKPERVAACPERDRTNTPLQALKQWNDDYVLKSSRALGQISWQAGDNWRDRIDNLITRALSRPARDAERVVLKKRFRQFRELYASAPEDADRLIDDAVVDETDRASAAAWIALARVVMNLDEFLVRQ